ncbi:UNVERIFIED_ORG: C4-dicarboxylate transporter [Shinella zoogloeoides]|nr:C4-dicarboxylate transporter [Shinella zoogloeoides]
MLALRILSLPIAMAALVALYIVANKAPHAVESVNIVVWLILPIIVGMKILEGIRRRKSHLKF